MPLYSFFISYTNITISLLSLVPTACTVVLQSGSPYIYMGIICDIIATAFSQCLRLHKKYLTTLYDGFLTLDTKLNLKARNLSISTVKGIWELMCGKGFQLQRTISLQWTWQYITTEINQSCQQAVEIINVIEMMVIKEHWLAYNLTHNR